MGLEAETDREGARRRADAVGLLAERALGAGFGSDGAPISGARAERFVVTVLTDEATLRADEATLRAEEVPLGAIEAAPSPDRDPGRARLEDGTRVPAETSRRLSCDCGVVRMTRAPDGAILDVGRRTRSIPPALRRALEVRDGGCRFPGCNARFTDGHHVTHWADGGPTTLANCLLLCRVHHRLVHEDGWRVEWWDDGRAAFRDPRGQVHFDGGWRPPALPRRPVDALVHGNRARGVEPDPRRIGARWKREVDIPAAVLLGAMEAVG